MPSPGRRVLLVVGLLLALLAAVAVAATGGVAPGTGSVRRPSHQLLDALASLLLIWIVVGSVLVVGLVSMRRDVLVASARRRRERGRLRGLLTGAVLFLLLGMFLWVVGNREQSPRTPLLPQLPPGAPAGENVAGRYEPRFAPVPVLLVGGLVLTGVAAAYVAHRAHRRRRPPDDLALVLADVLAETLDDLRAEVDPRRAVIAAYARMERALAAFGLPRRPAEAPQEYVERVLLELQVGSVPVSRLTTLYARAKFSHHDVEARMKDEAIGALESVREELRVAEAREAQERAAALEAAREQAARA